MPATSSEHHIFPKSHHTHEACDTTQTDNCTKQRLPLILSFVVLTYNTRDFLRNCLTSVLEECESLASNPVSCNIVVVDNASSDGTCDMVQDEFPSVHLISHSKNVGSAKGFNAGVARALPESDFLVVMNSDIIILPGTIKKMLAFLKAHEEVDGVSCALYNPDRTPQHTRTSIVRILPKDKSKPFRAEFPGTGFAMYRAETFRKVGGYDEKYYFYNEDLDWAVRAKRLGCIFYFLPEARAIHIGAGGRRHNVSGILKELYRSNLYFYRLQYPRLTWLAYLILKAEIAIRIQGIQRQIRAFPAKKNCKNMNNRLKSTEKPGSEWKRNTENPACLRFHTLQCK